MRTVDLNTHINENHTADIDFAVDREPIYIRNNDGAFVRLQNREAVIRPDRPSIPLGIISPRYKVIEHRDIISTIDEAIAKLNVGAVPRGIYGRNNGSTMDALYKFPALTETLVPGDDICPCLKIRNSYDGSTRIMVGIGAFRFVCTNLAVGGKGCFASGFVSVHYSNVEIGKIAEKLSGYLEGFSKIMETYRLWMGMQTTIGDGRVAIERAPKRHLDNIFPTEKATDVLSVWELYNLATAYATRNIRSAARAFEILAIINLGFQKRYTEKNITAIATEVERAVA